MVCTSASGALRAPSSCTGEHPVVARKPLQQRPLAQRWHLVLPDRPGHGQTPAEGREDFERDAALLAPLLGPGGAHVVGHSYGGVVALYIAARHPELVRSLILIEPSAFWLAPEDPATVAMSAANRTLIEDPPSDPWETLERFFALVGMEPLPAVLASTEPLPPPLIQAVHILLSLRGPWEGDVPMTELRLADRGQGRQVAHQQRGGRHRRHTDLRVLERVGRLAHQEPHGGEELRGGADGGERRGHQ